MVAGADMRTTRMLFSVEDLPENKSSVADSLLT